MYSLNGTKVLLVRMAQPYHANGVGQLGPGAITTSGTGSRSFKLDLTYVDGGVEVKGTTETGRRFRLVIPMSNIVGMDLELEAEKEIIVKEKKAS